MCTHRGIPNLLDGCRGVWLHRSSDHLDVQSRLTWGIQGRRAFGGSLKVESLQNSKTFKKYAKFDLISRQFNWRSTYLGNIGACRAPVLSRIRIILDLQSAGRRKMLEWSRSWERWCFNSYNGIRISIRQAKSSAHFSVLTLESLRTSGVFNLKFSTDEI